MLIDVLHELAQNVRSRAARADEAGSRGERNYGELLAKVDQSNDAGNHGEALRAIRDAVTRDGPSPVLKTAEGVVYYQWARYADALDLFRACIDEEGPGQAATEYSAFTLLMLGRPAEAEGLFRKSLSRNPASPTLRDGLLSTLWGQKRYTDVEKLLGEWFSEDDSNPIHLTWRGLCANERHDSAEAERIARRVLDISRSEPLAWVNLGVALNDAGRHEDALAAFQAGLDIDARTGYHRDLFVNVAKQYIALERLEEAAKVCEEFLPEHPSVEGHYIYAEALLKAGRLVEGWDQYEVRWIREHLLTSRHGPSRPAWWGQDLKGKGVVLRVEQGMGDIIQFVRYAPMVKALGARVILGSFSKIALSCEGVDDMIAPDRIPEYAYYANLMTLPRIFETTLDTIPAKVPYLTAEPGLAARWHARIPKDGKLNAGLVWAGNPKHIRDRERSMSLSEMEPLLEVSGIRWFSLQKGPAESQITEAWTSKGLVDLASELNDYSDTAAAIEALDLVVCVDTSVAHLAGALGKPVWLLLPREGEWRWLGEDRLDSPWYPSMRIFRQQVLGDWRTVMLQVVKRLQDATQDRSKLVPDTGVAATYPPAVVAERWKRWTPLEGIAGRLSATTETIVGVLQHFPGEPYVGPSIDWYGEYQLAQLDLLLQLIPPGATVVHAMPGAGFHLIGMSARLGAEGRIYAFEPRSKWHRVLKENVKASGMHPRTVLLNRALGRQFTARNGPQAPADRLDDHFLDVLHLIKIDAGADSLSILEGAEDTIWRLRPTLFVATRGEDEEVGVANRLRELGYRVWRMKTPYFRESNFNRRESDIFDGAVATAMLGIPEEVDVDMAFPHCQEI